MVELGRLNTRRAFGLLTALIAVLVVLFGASTHPASAAAGSETRVRASGESIQPFVGPPQDVSAGQKGGATGFVPTFVVATGVAANDEAGLLEKANAARDAELNRLTKVRTMLEDRLIDHITRHEGTEYAQRDQALDSRHPKSIPESHADLRNQHRLSGIGCGPISWCRSTWPGAYPVASDRGGTQ